MIHSHNFRHLAGKKGSQGGKKRKKKHRTNTKKNRRRKRGSARNKYEDLAPKKNPWETYSKEDKSYRRLPISGEPGEVKRVGTIILFHSRRYITKEEVTIPKSGAVVHVNCKLE